jgi:hypothetical protein
MTKRRSEAEQELIETVEDLIDERNPFETEDTQGVLLAEEHAKMAIDRLLQIVGPDRTAEAAKLLCCLIDNVATMVRRHSRTKSLVGRRIAKQRAKSGGKARGEQVAHDSEEKFQDRRKTIMEFCKANPGMTKTHVSENVELDGENGEFLSSRQVARIIEQMQEKGDNLGLKQTAPRKKVCHQPG